MAHIGFLHALRGLQPNKTYQLSNDELWTLINKAGIKIKPSNNQEENIKMFKSPQNYQNFVGSHIHNTINQTKRRIQQKLNYNVQNGQLASCGQTTQGCFLKKKQRFEQSLPIILKEIDEQITCSICLEIFLQPVLTPCGHAFCYQCMDNHLLLKTTCPICRQDIKNTKFKIDMTIENIVNSVVSNCEDPEKVSKYQQRLQQAINWRIGREVTPNILQIGSKLDIRDTEAIWCKGQILDIYYKGDEIEALLVHYDKWHRLYDEVIYLPNIRLAPYGYFTNRTSIICYNLRLTQDNLRGSVISPQSRASNSNLYEAIQQQEDSQHSSQNDINEIQQQAVVQFNEFVRNQQLPSHYHRVVIYPHRIYSMPLMNNFIQFGEEQRAAFVNDDDNVSIMAPSDQEDSNMEQQQRNADPEY